jgi:hypothetical protein
MNAGDAELDVEPLDERSLPEDDGPATQMTRTPGRAAIRSAREEIRFS